MSGTDDKIQGKGEELLGKVKQGVGGATDNASLEAEGKADEAKGEGRGILGGVKNAVEDAVDGLKKKA